MVQIPFGFNNDFLAVDNRSSIEQSQNDYDNNVNGHIPQKQPLSKQYPHSQFHPTAVHIKSSLHFTVSVEHFPKLPVSEQTQ